MNSETIKVDEVLELAQRLTAADRQWLIEQLSRLDKDEFPYFTQYGKHPRAEIEVLNERLEKMGVLGETTTLSREDVHYKTYTTLEEAMGLYLLDKCSLGRAAELAGQTRWNIMDELAAHNIPTNGGHDLSDEDYEKMLTDFEADFGENDYDNMLCEADYDYSE